MEPELTNLLSIGLKYLGIALGVLGMILGFFSDQRLEKVFPIGKNSSLKITIFSGWLFFMCFAVSVVFENPLYLPWTIIAIIFMSFLFFFFYKYGAYMRNRLSGKK